LITVLRCKPRENYILLRKTGNIIAQVHVKVVLNMPKFQLNNSSWSTIVIWRRGRKNRGYHLDSLGQSNTNGEVFEKIKSAFTGRRDRFSWVSTSCWPQVESECGFRTVEAIRCICLERALGTDVDTCIKKAGLVGHRREQYCSLSLRRTVALRVTEVERRHMSLSA